MKILLFRGSFTWDPSSKEPISGLICWCHAEHEDRIKFETIATRILNFKKKDEDVVLVPFSCLGPVHTKMDYDFAKVFFEKIKNKIPSSTLVPFNENNELGLNVPSGSFVKFLQI